MLLKALDSAAQENPSVIGLSILIVSQGTGLLELIGLIDKLTATIYGPPFALLGLSILGYGFTHKSEI